MKKCSQCQQSKAVDLFGKDKSRGDGVDTQCKECRRANRLRNLAQYKEKDRIYHQEHRTERLKYNNEKYQLHKAEICDKKKADRRAKRTPTQVGMFKWADLKPDYNRRYGKANQEALREKKKKYNDEHKEQRRARSAQYRLDNLEKKRNYQRAWLKSNRDKVSQYGHKRRALKMGSVEHFTAEQWDTMKRQYNYTCLCCKRQEPEITLTADHVVPLAKGGGNGINNLQPLCQSCNSSKKDKSTDYR